MTNSHLAVGALAGALASSAAMRISTSNKSLNADAGDNNADSSSSTPSRAARSPKGSGSGSGRSFPSDKHVGILAMEVYVPSTYVSQSSLEEHCGVSSGRYTIGLGQEAIGVVGDNEDVNSLALTVVHNLLEKYDVDPAEVGRLEVGTESLVDKSKSTKTVLMDLFGDNTDVEGATVINACYGGTAALFNAFAWVESDGWDGRFAIVVAADIAAYARGPARPTCGAGAVAVLVGRDAPLAFSDPRERATHASNVWDFFKPDHSVEYPVVDGAHSQECYYRALEDCYAKFAEKVERLEVGATITPPGKGEVEEVKPFRATDPDYLVFHSPYNKLVQKSYARLFLLDARRDHERSRRIKLSESGGEEKKKEPASDDEDDHPLHKWSTKPREEWSQTYADRELEGVLKKMSADDFKNRLGDANSASKKIGNTYTASVFFGLASLVDRCADPSRQDGLTPGKTVVVFSYGSGALASMYRLHVRTPTDGRFTLSGMASRLDLHARLGDREEVHPSELDLALDTRERMHSRPGAAYSPVYPAVGRMFPGTYFLSSVDSSWRRVYCRVPHDAAVKPGGSLAPPIVLRRAREESCSGTPVTGMLSVLSGGGREKNDGDDAARRISCVVTGVSAGLPGRSSGGPVFGPDNLARLVRGEQCIEPVSGSTISALQEKNVVRLKKLPDGTAKRIPLRAESDVIRLAAQLGPLDLTGWYGVPPGLAETMDVAAQVAVAAGMEALKSAGLVGGRSNDPKEWMLPENLRDTTGVVYASSFPAMDAAVGEVMRFLQSKTVGAAPMERLVSGLRNRLLRASPDRELSDDDEAALARLLSRARETEGGGVGGNHDEGGGNGSASSDSSSASSSSSSTSSDYEFDRKFLFRVLVLGNAQLAQLSGCRGPNTQTNAACAGTTQAIAMAQDMLISGRAERVVVVAGDNASGDTLLPWLGSGFSALGAATTKSAVEDAALPFDKRRNGMLLGAGGIGMVLETEESALERLRLSEQRPGGGGKLEMKARLLATQYSNSAFHGAALDRKHIASELKRFLRDVEAIHGICKAEIAAHGVYFSHETCTHASSASSCAGNEVAALREAFGDELLSKLLVLNTKGFTGHPMGVSFEDVAAVEVLMRQEVPPIVNHRVKDEYLGDLNLSMGGSYSCRYALRFAAGFGSQVAFALYATAQDD